MTSSAMDVDQVLKSLASQSIKQGSNVRVAVRDLTLKALQQREFTLEQIGKILRSVTEGVSLGVGKREVKAEQALAAAVAGMDDALRKAVEASNLALHRLTGEGYDYERLQPEEGPRRAGAPRGRVLREHRECVADRE